MYYPVNIDQSKVIVKSKKLNVLHVLSVNRKFTRLSKMMFTLSDETIHCFQSTHETKAIL